jgi:hypothetical protein
MTYEPTDINDHLKTLPKPPPWVTSGRAETFEAVALRSGAILMVLDQLVSDPSQAVPLKLLANQLALQAATATSKLEPPRFYRRLFSIHSLVLTPRLPDGIASA